MLCKCFTQYASKSKKLSSGHRTGKVVFIPIPKKGNAKEYSNYCTVALILYASNVQISPNQGSTVHESKFQDVQAGFKKGGGTRDQTANIRWITERAREFQKTSTSALLTMPKPLCGSQQTMENS